MEIAQGTVIVIVPEVVVRLGELACTWRLTTTGGGGGGGGGPVEDPPHADKQARRKTVRLQIALPHTGSNLPVMRFVANAIVRNRASRTPAILPDIRGQGTNGRYAAPAAGREFTAMVRTDVSVPFAGNGAGEGLKVQDTPAGTLGQLNVNWSVKPFKEVMVTVTFVEVPTGTVAEVFDKVRAAFSIFSCALAL